MASDWGAANDAKRSAVRAIRALGEVIDYIDQGRWIPVQDDCLPHIRANIDHVSAMCAEISRGRLAAERVPLDQGADHAE